MPFDDPPIVNSSCLWIFTIASGRTMSEGTFDRRRTPVFALASKAAARNSLAPWGLRSERSAVKSIVEALRSRAGIGRNRSVDEMRRTAAMPTVSYRRFPPGCLP